MSYMDTVEKHHRQQHSDPRIQRWQEEERAEDRARELVAESVRSNKYLDVRPTAEQVAAIEEAHKLAGTKPAWSAILRAANERAARACALEYRDEIKRAEQAAEQQGD